MLFHTPQFLVFFLLLLGVLALFDRDQGRKYVLLFASYVFYMAWNPVFILLIVFSTVLDFIVGRRLAAADAPAVRRALLTVSLIGNLGVLGFFKYFGFFEQNLNYLMRLFGHEPSWTSLNIILPVGISFYTFQTLSYTIDIYRNKIEPSRAWLDFAIFVSFFPQLVAGPIVRAAEFLPQLDRLKPLNFNRVALFLILRGLVKKVVVADGVSPFADAVFADVSQWPSLIIWIAAVAFYVQIYCDFSGYTDMAIGIARVLGFALPENFRRPYFAANPPDFWSRWHISLSTWLRDYLYISLGGNRGGTGRTYRNLMLTMVLGGLWHGAGWNFVLWGGLHGFYLIVHRAYGTYLPRLADSLRGYRWYAVASWLLMQFCVLTGWIAFRVHDLGDLTIALRKFLIFDFDFSLVNIGLGTVSFFSTVLLILGFLMLHMASNFRGGADVFLARARLTVSIPLCVLIGAALFVLYPTAEKAFIYFQF